MHSILADRIGACRICAERFAATATAHAPSPVVWFEPSARILIASQAPGLRAHNAGKPFADNSGDRLRNWLGLTESEFYDRGRVAVVPAAFCFPGYGPSGSDLPPPRTCAATWHSEVMMLLRRIELRVLVGAHAHRLHAGTRLSVTDAVRAWRDHAPGTFFTPEPSWRNNAWLRRNGWFEADLLPALQVAVRQVLDKA